MDHQITLLQNARSVHILTNQEGAYLGMKGIADRNMVVTGSGVDLPLELEQDDLTWSSQQAKEPYAIFIGRLSYDKGAIHAANAILKARRKGAGINLILVGQPTTEFERYYSNLSTLEKAFVKQMGVLPESRKQALLDRANMLILPSRTDSFGIVILEAWTHSKPVIGARAGGLTEVISDGEDGFLVDFGDVDSLAKKINTLFEKPQIGARFAQAGQQKIKNRYNWDHVSLNVLASYESLLQD